MELRESISRLFDLPTRETGVTLEGRQCVRLLGCAALLTFSAELVRARMPEGVIRIEGRGLRVRLLRGCELEAAGRVSGVSWEGEENT